MPNFRLREHSRKLLIFWGLCASAAVLPEAHAQSLGDALRATLRNHPAVAGQLAEVQARRFAADSARSQRYPTLSAQAQRYTDGNRSVLSGDDLSNPAVLRLRQPIWAFGRISDSIDAAEAEIDTEQAYLLRVQRQLVEETALAYVTVQGSRQRIELARRNVSELETLHAQITRRVQGQLASSADAHLAATRLAQGRARLQQALSEWEIAREDLLGLTQEAISAADPIPSGLLEVPEGEALIEQAMDQSADIRLRQRQLGQAEAEVERARSSQMPTLYLQADKLYDQPGLRDDNQVSVVFEASLDGLGLAARGRRGEALANRSAANQELAAARIEFTRELKRLYRSRALQAELIALQTQSLDDLESLLASYQRQYETGSKSWLDLMNIQRELFTQRHDLLETRIDWQIYSLKLLARIGGLDPLAGIEERNSEG